MGRTSACGANARVYDSCNIQKFFLSSKKELKARIGLYLIQQIQSCHVSKFEIPTPLYDYVFS